ncbi:unnamed protein product [Vitrella brassicaformis CCMP3155]|uniref:RNA helicase n=2 Tax=Vitrella brassicaformis TaxID=1169539 RepID=A0A0G4GXW0_VITBC|nr:unnamed protein product [Vitrella brassicaformis CCMP3155]|eukprot:CEM35831.1 unnamed protein product [Vitrella brassicaformis CCMP3155]
MTTRLCRRILPPRQRYDLAVLVRTTAPAVRLASTATHVANDPGNLHIRFAATEKDGSDGTRRGSSSGSGEKARSRISLQSTFHRYPFTREVQLALLKLGLATPTPVQELIIPKLMERKSLLVIGQTGSGKTLGYVLPMVNRLIDKDTERLGATPMKPQCLILVPTREMAAQILKTVRQFPVQSTACSAGLSYVKEVKALREGVDVVIGTPWRVLFHLDKGNMHLTHLDALIIDEADTLCDTFYEQEVLQIIRLLRKQGPHRNQRPKPQIVMVGATRTGAVSTFVRNHLGEELVPMMTPDAHLTVPALQQVFVPLQGKERTARLHEVLEEKMVKGAKTMVFCNTVKSCRFVDWTLQEKGYSVSSLHGELPFKMRRKSFYEFQSGKSNVLVCTNLASRGLDLSDVQHVVMYDFPHTLADYIHRVGRTARGGEAGRVTTLFTRRTIPLVKKIKEAARAGNPLDLRYATSNIRKILALERRHQAIKKLRNSKLKKGGRRRWNLPPSRNCVSPQTRIALKKLHFRLKAENHLAFLRRRKMLHKKELLPRMPKQHVETSDAQEFTKMIRADDGLLQLVPSRRSYARRNRDSASYDEDAIPMDVPTVIEQIGPGADDSVSREAGASLSQGARERKRAAKRSYF